MGLGIIFAGQGTQHPAMFQGLTGGPAAAPLIARTLAAAGLEERQGTLPEGDAIFRNRTAQPLVVGHALALWEELRDRLPTPAAVLGYSVGELAAASAAGVFAAEDAIALACRRAELMDAASDERQGMIAVRGRLPDLARQIEAAGAWIAIENGDAHSVAGGTAAAVARLTSALERMPLSIRRLSVTVASHTPLMQGAVEPFRQALDECGLKPPRLPFLAARNARRPRDANEAADALSAQIAETLRWKETLRAARERGVTAFLEIGPGDHMTRIVEEVLPGVPARSVQAFRSLDGISTWASRAG